MKYRPSRDLSGFAREYHTLSPTELSKIVLSQRNEKVTPESVTMWFIRHPGDYAKLRAEIVEEQLPEQEVDPTIFSNGVFEELPSVKNWIREQQDREISKSVIQNRLGILKQSCRGRFPTWKVDLVADGTMSFKHPDRLSLEDGRELIRIIREKGFDAVGIRLTLRDFFRSKGVTVGTKIAGGKSKGFGKFAQLYVERPIIDQMLKGVYDSHYEAGLADDFMFHTATRVTATLTAKIENLKWYPDHAEVTVYDKARRSMYPEGKPWTKFIKSELAERIKQHLGDRRTGRIFQGVNEKALSKLNGKMIQAYCPVILDKYGRVMNNHFWRHMFAQHMLRATGWNYTIVAYLGGWDVKSLQESYGKPPDEQIREWGLKEMPRL